MMYPTIYLGRKSMINKFLAIISDQVNIRFAWEKVKNYILSGDYWFDELDLASFELNLEDNLKIISESFLKMKYRLSPIKPLPFPKTSDIKGKEKFRQIFYISIIDQVAWVAFVNIVGPYLDSMMPTWSYGNRLFRSIWIEEDNDGKKKKKIGRYRSSSGKLYLPFQQSWPVYKRHIALAINKMTNCSNSNYLDERTKEEDLLNQGLLNKQQCPFIKKEYWERKLDISKGDKQLYWCSIDFKKFYPSIKLDIIKKTILANLPKNWILYAEKLLNCLLDFKIFIDDDSLDFVKDINIRKNSKSYNHLPTGLYVSGFLANVAMLNIDNIISKELDRYNIAHFRFVDDHIILAYSFDDLTEWICNYFKIINAGKNGIDINFDKVKPIEFSNYIKTYIKNKGLY